MTDSGEARDFETVTRAKAQDIEDFIRPPKDTRETEEFLKKRHGLQYDLAQVRYNFDPGFFRLESLDFNSVVQSLTDKYGLYFRVPDIVKMAALGGPEGDPTGRSPNDLMKQVMDGSNGLMFRDGLLKYQDKGADVERVIRIVNLHSQNLTVTVDGTSREAEFIAERISLDLQVAQGMQPHKEAFTSKVSGKQYMCTTALQLGAPISKLFSRNFNSFLTGSVKNDLGWKMAMRPVRPYEKTDSDYDTVVAFHELEFAVGIFDKVSGNQYSSDLRIGTTNRNFYGSDYVSVTSQLSTDDHLHLVRELIRALTGK